MSDAAKIKVVLENGARALGATYKLTLPVKRADFEAGVLDADIARLRAGGVPWAVVHDRGPSTIRDKKRLACSWVALWCKPAASVRHPDGKLRRDLGAGTVTGWGRNGRDKPLRAV